MHACTNNDVKIKKLNLKNPILLTFFARKKNIAKISESKVQLNKMSSKDIHV